MQNRIEDFPGLIAQLECMFSEMCSDITVALRDTDEEYAALREQRKALAERFPFIDPLLEGSEVRSLNADEHAGLKEYLDLTTEMEYHERLNIYYAGHRDCFAYLRKIGAI